MRKNLLFILSLFATTLAFAQEPATFEDVPLGSGGIWQPPTGENEMPSGGWLFTNFNEYGYWGGFTASNRTDLNQTGLNAQYTAVTGCGYDGSSQYAVAYTYGMQTEVYAADGQSHTVTGCYITNNLWAYQDVLEGSMGQTPFGGLTGDDPDWFKLTATGKNASGQTIGTLDFYLADYRFDNPEDDYVLETWEWFDLSPLGEVASISFSLSSTKSNYGGMITPAYFCMDNFNGGGTAPDLPPYIVNPVPDVVFNNYPQTLQVNLDGVATDPDDPDENIVYSIVNNSNPAALTAAMNGKILVMTRQNANQATANLTMRATSDGQSVDFSVHVIINAYVDEPPYIISPVPDVVFDEYPQAIQVNLDGVATDPDDPDENITYSVISNPNPSALLAQVNNKTLNLFRQNENGATVDLVLRATSDGQYVNFNVHVIINAIIDEPPYIVNPVPDVVMDEFPKIVHIDLNNVATDPDDPDELIEYELVSNSNEAALSATMSGKVLMLERLTEDQAVADLEMRAVSDGQFVDFNIHVIMNYVEGVAENVARFMAYPNPTSGTLTLTVADAQQFDYEIYNTIGQVVTSGLIIGHEAVLDLSDCPKGVYFVSILWNDNRLIQKVIVD